MTSRKVKSWGSAPEERMRLMPDLGSYSKSISTPCCGSNNIRQPVLWVQKSPTAGALYLYNKGCFESVMEANKYKAGIMKDVWFVNETDLMTLPAKVPNSFMNGGATAGLSAMAQIMANPQAVAQMQQLQQMAAGYQSTSFCTNAANGKQPTSHGTHAANGKRPTSHGTNAANDGCPR